MVIVNNKNKKKSQHSALCTHTKGKMPKQRIFKANQSKENDGTTIDEDESERANTRTHGVLTIRFDSIDMNLTHENDSQTRTTKTNIKSNQ